MFSKAAPMLLSEWMLFAQKKHALAYMQKHPHFSKLVTAAQQRKLTAALCLHIPTNQVFTWFSRCIGIAGEFVRGCYVGQKRDKNRNLACRALLFISEMRETQKSCCTCRSIASHKRKPWSNTAAPVKRFDNNVVNANIKNIVPSR